MHWCWDLSQYNVAYIRILGSSAVLHTCTIDTRRNYYKTMHIGIMYNKTMHIGIMYNKTMHIGIATEHIVKPMR